MKLNELPVEVLTSIVENLSHTSLLNCSLVTHGFRLVCLPQMFHSVYLATEIEPVSDSDKPCIVLDSAKDVSKFYTEFINGSLNAELFSLFKSFTFSGEIPSASQCKTYYKEGITVTVGKSDFIPGYGPATKHTLYNWFVQHIVGKYMENLRFISQSNGDSANIDLLDIMIERKEAQKQIEDIVLCRPIQSGIQVTKIMKIENLTTIRVLFHGSRWIRELLACKTPISFQA